ncbi:putative pentatricopeptide repeat-containing protein at3g01580 [Phtheirospermum japonicum]|uniref:Putative pentatricopeptide repeat-containing protein at3g01580 n=1 Tax=Phtheirospermum japonicum TaxID=374723 RepID=A0A830AWP3_9LAMI|nr:putative pentatricopeptide repeat-containing protein at3g01580 [Phtheirospermum japonicum]
MITGEQLIKLFEACKNGRCLNRLHSLTIRTGLTYDTLFAAKLIDLYSKFISLPTARKVFDEIPHKTIYIWNTILKLYCRDKQYQESLFLFSDLFLSEEPDLHTISIALKACAGLKAVNYGNIIHGFVRKTHQISRNLFVGSALVEFYSKCGKMDDALYVFDEFPEPDAVLWTTMITGYQQNSKPTHALELFTRMATKQGLVLDSIALINVVSACAQTFDLKPGKSVHGYMIRMGFENSLSLSNALLNLYGKTGSVKSAANLFEKMPLKDVISWGSMMACYAHNGCYEKALYLFGEISTRKIDPNAVVLISALQACEATCNLDMGRRIHKLASSKKFDLDILVSTALIDMYMNCRSPDDAIHVFGKMPNRDAVCFSSMLHGCVENGMRNKSIEVFRDMLGNNFQPDAFDVVKLLTACSELGVFEQTSCVHGFLIRLGLADNPFLRASLVESYAKCGSLDGAIVIFEQTVDRDVVIWSSMFAAYGFHGQGREALRLFNRMVENSSVTPNKVSFLSVLSACSHAGLLKEGIEIFNTMVDDYGLQPSSKHYGILVDLLGRVGELEKAVGFIGQIQGPVEADVWGALLNSCRIYGNMEIGEIAAKKLFELNKGNAGHYILLANMYADEEKWDDVAKVRRLVRERKLKKVSGQSVIIEIREDERRRV